MKFVTFCTAVGLAAFSLQASTLYVDAANYGQSGLDGTEARAYGTIQDAIDAAAKNDTIKVKPGVYDQGGKILDGYSYTLVHRVMINKPLTIESTEGRDVTHIVGYKDPEGDAYGRGLNAVRSVGVAGTGLGSSMTGFTIRDSTCFAGTAASLTNLAGGVYVYGAKENFTMTACAFSNCVAYTGGAVRGGRYFRCLFDGNTALDGGSAASSAKLVNCVIVRQRNPNVGSTLNGSCYALNCTIAGNRTSDFSDTKFYNCVLNCNAAGGSESTNYLYASVSVALGDGLVHLEGPSIGKYRPLASSVAVGRGKTRYLGTDVPFTIPEGADMRDFEGNEIDLSSASCVAGAYQTTVTPRYGGIYIDTKAKVNGNEMHGPNYFFADTWPMQVKVEPILEGGNVFQRYMLANGTMSRYPPLADRGARSRFLQEDGSLYLTPPASPTEVMTNTAVYATKTLYVDASHYGEEGLDGTKDKPYGTIQDAVDKCTSQTQRYLILVKPGDYNRGGALYKGVLTRVVFPNGYYILLKSTAGAVKTIIRGAADTTAPRDSANYPGLGPNAVRCVAVKGSSGAVALQGFTLADGHTDAATTTESEIESDTCGGFYGPLTSGARAASQILDCVITNCSGVTAGGLIYAWASRCKLVGCTGVYNTARYAFLSSCLVADCGANALGSEVYTLNCTVPNVTLSQSSWHYNSLFGDHTTFPNSSQYWGSLFKSGKPKDSSAIGAVVADPSFVQPNVGDWRVLDTSFAGDDTRRIFPVEGDSNWGKFVTNYAQFATSDLKGRPWLTGGVYPVAGAYQEVVPGIVITDPEGVLSVVGATVGTNALAAGASVTIGRLANPSRNAKGVIVDGVTNLWSALPNGVWTYTVPDEVTGLGPTVVPYIVPDWYVDPTGDDLNDGCSPETPKRTLAAALGMAIRGDTVHAAAGVYDEGTMPPPDSEVKIYSSARAVIYPGVLLVAEAGAANTIIQGAEGTDEWTDKFGCGSNAVRCVIIGRNALVKGFTLRGGRTNPGSKGGVADYCGAGAAGFDSSSRHYARVQDCVITDCRSHNGSAARYVALFNTTVTNNYATVGVTSECDFYGATINGNYADTASVYQFTIVHDSTIGPDAWKLNGKPGVALSVPSTQQYGTLCNTLVLGTCSTPQMQNAPTNCAFVAEKVTGGILNNVVDSIATNAAALAVDAELRPVAGVNVACDRANPALLPPAQPSLWPYIQAQRTRLTNGALDIGAKEADWRAIYARDIGGRTMTVSSATSNVVESAAHTVYINPGESLTGTWAGKAGRAARYTLPLRVTGSGTLTVTINGEAHTFSAGESVYNFVSALAVNSLTFVYEGEGQAEILNGSRLAGLTLSFR